MSNASPVPRSVRADAAVDDRLYLIKNVSRLTATYQIRLLTYTCTQEGKKLVLMVPNQCRFDESLDRLIALCPSVILRQEM